MKTKHKTDVKKTSKNKKARHGYYSSVGKKRKPRKKACQQALQAKGNGPGMTKKKSSRWNSSKKKSSKKVKSKRVRFVSADTKSSLPIMTRSVSQGFHAWKECLEKGIHYRPTEVRFHPYGVVTREKGRKISRSIQNSLPTIGPQKPEVQRQFLSRAKERVESEGHKEIQRNKLPIAEHVIIPNSRRRELKLKTLSHLCRSEGFELFPIDESDEKLSNSLGNSSRNPDLYEPKTTWKKLDSPPSNKTRNKFLTALSSSSQKDCSEDAGNSRPHLKYNSSARCQFGFEEIWYTAPQTFDDSSNNPSDSLANQPNHPNINHESKTYEQVSNFKPRNSTDSSIQNSNAERTAHFNKNKSLFCSLPNVINKENERSRSECETTKHNPSGEGSSSPVNISFPKENNLNFEHENCFYAKGNNSFEFLTTLEDVNNTSKADVTSQAESSESCQNSVQEQMEKDCLPKERLPSRGSLHTRRKSC